MQIRRHHFLCFTSRKTTTFFTKQRMFKLRKNRRQSCPQTFFFCLNVFKVACKYLSFSRTVPDDHLLHGVSQATKVYYNYTGSSPCLNTSQTATGSLGFLGWFYQVCRDVAVLHLIHHEVNVQPLICRPARRW